jgi:hypothetical protein
MASYKEFKRECRKEIEQMASDRYLVVFDTVIENM